MSDDDLKKEDYPLAENRPDVVVGSRGKALDELTMDGVMSGEVTMEDLRITPRALQQQAQIARSVGRNELAANFERAAEMSRVPQDQIMRLYELLRPGRAESKEALLEEAVMLKRDFDAPLLAAFVEEAANLYERRGLFQNRF